MPAIHVSPKRTYFAVFGALLFFTALTVFVAVTDLGALSTPLWGNLIAMGIAVTKGTLVVLFFMHVAHSTRLTKLVVTSGFFWLLLMFLFTLADYLSRGWLGVAGK